MPSQQATIVFALAEKGMKDAPNKRLLGEELLMNSLGKGVRLSGVSVRRRAACLS